MLMQESKEQEVVVSRKPFICPTDPAELEQCDSCQ